MSLRQERFTQPSAERLYEGILPAVDLALRMAMRSEVESEVGFAPHSLGEAEMIRIGLEERLFRAGRTRKGQPQRAVEEVASGARRYGGHASSLVSVFHRAGSENNLDIIDPVKLSDTLTYIQVTQALTDHLLAKEELDDYEWLGSGAKQRRHLQIYHFLIGDREFNKPSLPVDALAAEVQSGLNLEKARAQYWIRIARAHDPISVANANM